MRLAICVPSGDMLHAAFAMSLAGAVRLAPVEKLSLLSRRQSLICHSRNMLVCEALERGADAILWLDSDMTFPPTTVGRLLVHGLDYVGCQYVRRVPPHTPTGTRLEGAVASATGLVEMESLGFGCLLVSRKVLEMVPPPWFRVDYRDDGSPIGEDVYFARRARGMGVQIFADMRLSLEVRHLGEAAYALGPEDAL